MFTFDIVTFALAINSLVLKIAIAINHLVFYIERCKGRKDYPVTMIFLFF